MVLLPGLGDNAHVFDRFAPKLTSSYHIYGITRRGFGASSIPETGYSADRLGDDILAVIDSLRLARPVLAGHSIAGEELSSIGSRHPEKVAGLIYLDAANSYSLYDPPYRTFDVDLDDLRNKLDRLQQSPFLAFSEQKQLMDELVKTTIPAFEAAVREHQKDLDATPIPPALRGQPPPPPHAPGPDEKIRAGEQKYTNIAVPILAIMAVPQHLDDSLPLAEVAVWEARSLLNNEAEAKAFETRLPSARVVRLPRADHYVFRSNEADVLREMRAFIDKLP